MNLKHKTLNQAGKELSAIWQAQLQAIKEKPWLAGNLLKQAQAFWQWVNDFYHLLRRLPRHWQRRLQRGVAGGLISAALLLAAGPTPPAYAAAITVNDTGAAVADDGMCTLIEAIIAANSDTASGTLAGECAAGSGADTIILSGNTYTLTAVNNTDLFGGANGLPTIESNITIEGNGATITRDGGAPPFRILAVIGGNLTLNEATISNGDATGSPQGGGGLFNFGGTVTINNSTISGNSAGGEGGGLFNAGLTGTAEMIINNSTISGNSANGVGGGVSNLGYFGSGTLTINDSTISGNSAGGAGGGVSNYDYDGGATASLNRSLISGNTAPTASEVHNDSGAINANSDNLFGHSGLSNAQALSGFTPAGSDLTATSDGSHPTDLTNILDTTLADNGGDTETHALVSGSPAIDAAPTGPAADQRGVSRPQGTAFDIGAFEAEQLADATPPVITPNVSGALGNNDWYTGDVSVNWTVTDDESDISSTNGCDEMTIDSDTPGVTLNCEATSDGGSNAASVAIKRDATPPTVSLTGVEEGATYEVDAVPTAACDTQDALSGVATQASLTTTGDDGNGLGTFTTTCEGATDNAGNAAGPVSVSYTVTDAAPDTYDFSGFFPPVNNPPAVNEDLTAGRAIQIRFSLNGDQGLDILAEGYPVSQEIDCDSQAPVGEIEETDTPGNSSLKYNRGKDRYQYLWKTVRDWKQTCRQFILRLDDGSDHTAYFKFK